MTGTLTAVLAVAAIALGACGGGGDDGSATAGDAGSSSAVVLSQSVDGTDVLVDSTGRTLYTADVEADGRILCTGACTSVWDPVGASAAQADSAAAALDLDLGAVTRPGGGEQLTYEGLPLYTFTAEGPGGLEGDGLADDFEGTRFEWAAATTGEGSGDPDAPESGYGYSSPY